MNLFAKYTHEWVGKQWEREVVEKADLHIGYYYPVEQVIMTQSYTDITLARLGHFNSTFFEFYDEDGNKIDIYNDPRYNPYLLIDNEEEETS